MIKSQRVNLPILKIILAAWLFIAFFWLDMIYLGLIPIFLWVLVDMWKSDQIGGSSREEDPFGFRCLEVLFALLICGLILSAADDFGLFL